MKNNMKRVMLASAIVLAVFTVIALIVPAFTKNTTFWIAFGFGALAIVVQPLIIKRAFADGKSVKSKLYGFPIAKLGLVYLAVQIVVSIVFMICSSLAPWWAALIAILVILALCLLGLIAVDATQDTIEQMDEKLKSQVTNMQDLRSRVYPLAEQVDDAKAKEALTKLAEDFRYSDPVSNDATLAAEAELKNLLDELQQAVIDGDNDSVLSLSKRASIALSERNRLCKLNKN